jgi:hypothetical protein
MRQLRNREVRITQRGSNSAYWWWNVKSNLLICHFEPPVVSCFRFSVRNFLEKQTDAVLDAKGALLETSVPGPSPPAKKHQSFLLSANALYARSKVARSCTPQSSASLPFGTEFRACSDFLSSLRESIPIPTSYIFLLERRYS